MARDTDGVLGSKKEKERDIEAEKVPKREQPGMLFVLDQYFYDSVGYSSTVILPIRCSKRFVISTILTSAPLVIKHLPSSKCFL